MVKTSKIWSLLAYMAAGRRRLIKSCLISLFKSGVASTDILEMLKHTCQERGHMNLASNAIELIWRYKVLESTGVQDYLQRLHVKVQCNQTHHYKHSAVATMTSVFACKQQKAHMNLPQYLQEECATLSKTLKHYTISLNFSYLYQSYPLMRASSLWLHLQAQLQVHHHTSLYKIQFDQYSIWSKCFYSSPHQHFERQRTL